MGIICFLGNILVVTQKIKPIWKKIQKPKEIKIYSILIFNLSVADLLMGIYLVGISVKMKKSIDQSNCVVESGFCNLLGITNLVSGQVSLTTLIGISYFRLYSLICSYKQVNVKLAVVLIFSFIRIRQISGLTEVHCILILNLLIADLLMEFIWSVSHLKYKNLKIVII